MSKALRFLPILCWLLFGPVCHAQEAGAPDGKVTLKLTSGDTMTGTVGAVRDGSVSLMTEYGVVRVPVAKLSPETKKQIGISAGTELESLKQRVAELETLVAKLRDENAALRKSAIQAPTPAPQPLVSGGGSSGARIQPATEPSTGGSAYRISTTGKRHNSRCRYYTSGGRACSSSEGVACKICGG